MAPVERVAYRGVFSVRILAERFRRREFLGNRPLQPRYDADSIRALFDEMAGTYGVVNLISSFGFAARWRHQAVGQLREAKPTRVIDLMSGMGELWHSVARYLPATAHVTAIDLSPEMARRAKKGYPFGLEMTIADVLAWEYPAGCADAVVSSFGLKTFDRAQQALLAARVARMLSAGGVFSFVEISVPRAGWLRLAYMFYLRQIIPLIGRLFVGNPANYRMLGVYTEAFGDCRHFADCLETAGLRVTRVSYFFGCATGVCGMKTG